MELPGSANKGRSGANFNQQVHYQNSVDANQSPSRVLKPRRRINNLYAGNSIGKTLGDNEELQQERRQLKVVNNATMQENVRLKTRIQQLSNEMKTKDRDIETLTFKLQQVQGLAQPTSAQFY